MLHLIQKDSFFHEQPRFSLRKMSSNSLNLCYSKALSIHIVFVFSPLIRPQIECKKLLIDVNWLNNWLNKAIWNLALRKQ